jgi:hypothetical protein
MAAQMDPLPDHAAGQICLLEIADILDRWRIPYFLVQGTALGAYRDGGFTPTERDIDFGILQEHLQSTAVALLADFEHCGFTTEKFDLPFHHLRTLVVKKHGWKADLVGWIPWKDKRFVRSPVLKWLKKPYSIVHDRAMVENYDQVTLFGRTFNVPHPIEDYLRLEYGDDWRTPREDHISRTRIYHYVRDEGIPDDYLEHLPDSR